MKPWPKLLAQLAIATGLVLIGEFTDPLHGGAFRVLTSLGFIPSAILSVFWIVALTNAFNFLDNMDGLSGGIAFLLRPSLSSSPRSSTIPRNSSSPPCS